MSYFMYTDGACRGNPGPASVGVSILDETQNEVVAYHKYIGSQTNNYAEYFAVLEGLKICVEKSFDNVVLRSDSELLIKQLTGIYKIKSVTLKPLFLLCKEQIAKLASFKAEHVRREYNKRADALANEALDSRA